MSLKYINGDNGYKVHDASHNSGILDKDIVGFVVLTDNTTVTEIRIDGNPTDVAADFGADVPLKYGAQIRAKNGSKISRLVISSGQINYTPFLNSD